MTKEEFILELEKLNLQFVDTKSPHHKQILKENKPVINWWPSKGTTVLIGGKNWRCKDYKELIEFVRKNVK